MPGNYPLLAHAQVISQDPQGGVYVLLPSGQVPGASYARVIHYGPADGLRVTQKPLPPPGTWGLVAFPYGDSRNGIWIGSVYAAQVDARALPQDPNADYESHWSGAWSLMDGTGQYAKSFPDGTYLTVSSTAALPAVTRNIVNEQQVKTAIPYAASDRVTTPPSPFIVNLRTASGATIQIDASGNINVTAGSGGTINFNASTSMTFTTPVANFSAQLVWDSAGSATHATTHKHGGVQTGSGDTAAPIAGS